MTFVPIARSVVSRDGKKGEEMTQGCLRIIMKGRDGLYRVCLRDICAGFVNEIGKPVEIAPVLRKRFGFLQNRAVWLYKDPCGLRSSR